MRGDSAIVTIFCAALFALADGTPTAKIVGPNQANPGDLVVLDASGSTNAKGYAWVLAGSDKSILPVDGGQRVVFACGTAGRYTFVLVVGAVDDAGTPSVATAQHVVVIGEPPPPGPGPGPSPPGPGPLPPPVPPVPDGKFGLAKIVVDAAARVSVTGATRVEQAKRLAVAQRSVKSAIAAGAVGTPEAILGAWREQNNAAVAKADWLPVGEALSAKLKELYEGKRIATPDDWQTAFEEIAIGLEAVR